MQYHFLRHAAATGFVLLSALSATTASRADAPYSFAATPGQLPKTVVPLHYSLVLIPNLKALTLQGREVADIKVLAPTSRFVLSQLGLHISSASLTQAGSRRSIKPSVRTDNAAQTLTLTFPVQILPGRYSLAIAYRGKIGTQAQGLYSTTYGTTEGKQQMLATQLEATDARRVFPGWDEPSFRATYRMNAIVPQKFMVVSNTPITQEKRLPGGLKRVSFGQTPPMASYLVVLVAGDLEAVSGQADGIKLRVVTVRGKKQQGRYALSVMQKILPYYNSYFGVKYPLPKLDLIAVPGGFNGAMENWGGIVYNEQTLLFDPASSSDQSKRFIFSIVSHETAHQWFGDLVTMAWWDNLWLNEGFASWMAYKASDHFNPQWHIWEDAASDKTGVMQEDAVHTSHPIQQPIADPTQAAEAFDGITYDKGAAVIHMFEASVGEAPFRAGIQRYMKAHAYSNTTDADLWNALETATGKPVSQIAPGWTQQAGFPVVQVQPSADGSHVILTQQPFALDTLTPAPRQWQIPLVWQTLGGTETLGSTQPQTLTQPQTPTQPQTALLGTAPLLLPKPPGGIIEINAGNTGYYRTEYDPALLAPLAARLETLPAIDRVSLLGDTWALAKAGRVPMSEYLNLAQSAEADTSVAVDDQTSGSLGTLQFLEKGQPGEAAFKSFRSRVLKAQFASVGWEAQPGEPESTALRRDQLLSDLGYLDDPAVTAEAKTRFAAFVKNPQSLPPALRGPVFYIVGRDADQAVYDQLRALGRATNDTRQKSEFYRALASAKDPALARQTLNLTLTDELGPSIAPSLVFEVAYGLETPELALQFVQQHREALLAKEDALGRVTFLPSLFQAFTDPAYADALEADARTHPADDAPREVTKAAAQIRFNAALKQRVLPEVSQWITQQPRSASPESINPETANLPGRSGH